MEDPTTTYLCILGTVGRAFTGTALDLSAETAAEREQFTLANMDARTVDAIRQQCDVFVEQNADILEELNVPDDMIGHDFYLTRNGHGVGFWDRGYGELGNMLTDAAQEFGSFDLYLGDDGTVYGSPHHTTPQ